VLMEEDSDMNILYERGWDLLEVFRGVPSIPVSLIRCLRNWPCRAMGQSAILDAVSAARYR